MYKKIRDIIFTSIYILLWLRFVLLIGDPIAMGLGRSEGIQIYQDWATVVDFIYTASGYFVMPLYALWDKFLAGYFPQITDWFPYWPATVCIEKIITLVSETPNLPGSAQILTQLNSEMVRIVFKGVFGWPSIIAIVIIRLLRPLVDSLYEFLKNLIWNVLIEFSFSKKKQMAYQEKLQQRATDLMKLKVEYKNMSKEVSQLSEAVVTDELTQVYNKRFFIEKVRFEFKQAQTEKTILSLVMMDIDHFKKLNDTYGHMVGDIVLKAVAQAVKNGTPKGCFACRFGGEEFSVIMPGYTHEKAMAVLEPIRQKVEQLKFPDHQEVTTSISMGLATADYNSPAVADLKVFDDFVQLADNELYRAKLGGRNRINFNTLS